MKKGISIIVLIITIIVIIIIASSVIISLNRTNIIENANKAKIITYLNNFKDEFNLYVLDKKLENPEFNLITLNASKEGVMYNTKLDSKDNSIKNIIKSIDEKFLDKIEIVKGELVINTKDINEINAAKEVGIESNPYDIKDGELQSSENNLLLMDETGTLTIPNSIKSIGGGAFRNLNGLKTIVIPGNVEKIGNHAFSGNDTLENVILEEGIKEIGDFAFEECTSLKEIHLADSINKIGYSCFQSCKALKKINFPKNLTVIRNNTFYDCDSLEKVVIPEGITTLEWSCFNGCSNLKEVTIPKSCTYIDGQSFVYTTKLENIIIDKDNPKYFFEDGMLMSKEKDILYYILESKTSLNIPETITTLYTRSISGNYRIKEYYIPKNVTSIKTTFAYSVKKIDVSPENQYYTSINGNLYEKSLNRLIKYCSNEEVVNLPEGVKLIVSGAFGGQYNIKKLNLPESLEELDNFSLGGSNKDIYIGKNLKRINTTVFSNNNMNVKISSENPNFICNDGTMILSKDGKSLVAVCKTLEIYEIPKTVERLKYYAFYNNSKIKTFKIPNNIVTIEGQVFGYDVNLTRVEIPSSVKYIWNEAFNSCKNLTDIVIDKKEDEINGAPWNTPYGLRAIKWKR